MNVFDQLSLLFGRASPYSILISLENGKQIHVTMGTTVYFVDLLQPSGGFDKLNPGCMIRQDAPLDSILQAIIEAEDAAYAQGP